MIRGHLLQLVIIEPFSSEILSAGSPSLVIFALFPSLVRRSRGSTPGVSGILRSSISRGKDNASKNVTQQFFSYGILVSRYRVSAVRSGDVRVFSADVRLNPIRFPVDYLQVKLSAKPNSRHGAAPPKLLHSACLA